MLEIRPIQIPFRMILSLSIRDPLIARLAPGRERHTPTPGILSVDHLLPEPPAAVCAFSSVV
jgi:hypothetical protein